MESSTKNYVALGLMSGTSADGVDVALLCTDGESRIDFLGATTMPYSDSLRGDLLGLAQRDVPLVDVLRVQKSMTLAHEVAIRMFMSDVHNASRKIDIVGFHGHTIRHVAEEGLTWQIGDPNLLAHRLQVPVVSDFRRLDMAAGGQGAPLVPLFHQQLCRPVPKPTAILNLGGVGNLTWLGENDEIIASDTGPGCGLLDAWAEKYFGIAMDFDSQLGRQGTVNELAVEQMLNQPFFQRSLPKSADRFEFDVSPLAGLSPKDGLATLCAVTARAVHQVVRLLPAPPKTLYVTGGGAKNPLIMSMLMECVEDVQPVDALQQRSDSMEAECFAWLAVRRLRGLPTSLPSTTGCSVATSGGSLTGAARQYPYRAASER